MSREITIQKDSKPALRWATILNLDSVYGISALAWLAKKGIDIIYLGRPFDEIDGLYIAGSIASGSSLLGLTIYLGIKK